MHYSTQNFSTMKNFNKKKRFLYLVRHGETEFNREKLVQGRGIDTNLNENGKKQAQTLAQRFKNIPLDIIVSSPLKRAFQTSEYIQKYHPNAFVYQMKELEEMDYGEFEGKPFEADRPGSVFPKIKEIIQNWDKGKDTRIPNGEAPSDVEKRVIGAIHSILEKSLQQNKESSNILVVSHGRALKISLCRLLGQGLHEMNYLQQHNTCVNLLEWKGGTTFEAIYLNDTSHVRPEDIHSSFIFVNQDTEKHKKTSKEINQSKL